MSYRFFLLVLIFSKVSFSHAQYYYNDILRNKNLHSEIDTLKSKKIRKIIVHSFESDKTESEGFFCEKKISKNYLEMETKTRSRQSGKSIMTANYNESGNIVRSYDSTEFAASSTNYEYDATGKISAITFSASSNDDDFRTSHLEQHLYSYDPKGHPEKMFLVKNNKDTTEILFTLDAAMNVTDEIEKKVGGLHYYYYYDGNKRLTDIVKFNAIRKKLLPDFTFDYDEDGFVSQMIATEEGVSGNYVTWKYIYNNGLKIIEKCFDANNKLLGYVEYEYQ
jgi:hypothetical protein